MSWTLLNQSEAMHGAMSGVDKQETQKFTYQLAGEMV